jgi:glycosyltransferase involved in cell wall biosynthesis
MKILTAMYTTRRGGSYDRFRMMLEAVLERGWKVHCLSLNPIPVNHFGYQNHILKIPMGLRESLFGKMVVFFFFPLYAVWIGRVEKIDLFVAFSTLYAFIQGIPKWILRRPMVTFLRGDFAFGLRMQGERLLLLWLNQWIERVGIYFSDTIVSVNSTLQDEKKKTNAGRRKSLRWQVLPNNIPAIPIHEKQDISEIRKRYGIPEDAKVLVTAGVITRGKNLELLIRCLPEIGLENLFLLIAGDFSTEADFQYHASLKELIESLRLSNRVIFTGWLEKDQLWKIFQGTDVFILPSLSEGMPNVMLEALGCDLPCMGSRIPGIIDILHYGELMFPPTNRKVMVNTIKYFFSSDRASDEIRKLCEERKKVFAFDWKEAAFQMLTTDLGSRQ